MLTKKDKSKLRSTIFRHLDGIATSTSIYTLHKHKVLDHILRLETVDLHDWMSRDLQRRVGILEKKLTFGELVKPEMHTEEVLHAAGEELEESGLRSLIAEARASGDIAPKQIVGKVLAASRSRAINWGNDDRTLIISAFGGQPN